MCAAAQAESNLRMRDLDGFGPEDLRDFVDVSRETLERLKIIVSELDEWRRKTNLIGPSEFGRVWRRHTGFDSVAAPHTGIRAHDRSWVRLGFSSPGSGGVRD